MALHAAPGAQGQHASVVHQVQVEVHPVRTRVVLVAEGDLGDHLAVPAPGPVQGGEPVAFEDAVRRFDGRDQQGGRVVGDRQFQVGQIDVVGAGFGGGAVPGGRDRAHRYLQVRMRGSRANDVAASIHALLPVFVKSWMPRSEQRAAAGSRRPAEHRGSRTADAAPQA